MSSFWGPLHRVEKVSAIYQNKSDSSPLASRIKPPTEPVLDGKSDIYLTKSLSLNRLITQKVENIYLADFTLPGSAIIFPSIAALFVVFLIVNALDLSAICFLIPFAGMVIGILLMIRNGKKIHEAKVEENRFIKNKNRKLKNEWLIAANSLHDKWKLAYKRWEHCYYCHRDDIIFIPGESGYARPSELEEFCYKGLTDKTHKIYKVLKGKYLKTK